MLAGRLIALPRLHSRFSFRESPHSFLLLTRRVVDSRIVQRPERTSRAGTRGSPCRTQRSPANEQHKDEPAERNHLEVIPDHWHGDIHCNQGRMRNEAHQQRRVLPIHARHLSVTSCVQYDPFPRPECFQGFFIPLRTR